MFVAKVRVWSLKIPAMKEELPETVAVSKVTDAVVVTAEKFAESIDSAPPRIELVDETKERFSVKVENEPPIVAVLTDSMVREGCRGSPVARWKESAEMTKRSPSPETTEVTEMAPFVRVMLPVSIRSDVKEPVA